MKPLTVLHTEWSSGWGGQEIRVVEEMAGMAARGHRMLLCTGPKATIAERARARGFAVFQMDMRGNFDLAAAARLAGLARREKADFLHTHSSVDSWVGGWARRLFRAPCHLVRTRHTGQITIHPLNFIYKMPAYVIGTGQEVVRALTEDYGLSPDRVSSIPTGINPDRYRLLPPDPALAAELGLEPGQDVVAMVAVLRSWKRHDLFCQMAARILESRPQTRFLIVGNGPGWNRVNGYLDDMGLRGRVIMTGHREDVEKVLSLAKVVVLTSESVEGVSQSLSQALACEKGVVAAATGSTPDLVKDGETGLLVPFGDIEAMAQKVTQLLDDPQMLARLGRWGRQLVLNTFTIKHTLDATEAVYQKVLDQAARGN